MEIPVPPENRSTGTEILVPVHEEAAVSAALAELQRRWEDLRAEWDSDDGGS